MFSFGRLLGNSRWDVSLRWLLLNLYFFLDRLVFQQSLEVFQFSVLAAFSNDLLGLLGGGLAGLDHSERNLLNGTTVFSHSTQWPVETGLSFSDWLIII